jgi:anti-sigma factor RsiW
MTPHLTHEQLCDLILESVPPEGSKSAALFDHLRTCPLCASEFANLQSSLSLFREAANSWSGQAFAQMQSMPLPERPKRLALSRAYWALAAAVVFLAAIIPFTVHPRHQPPSLSTATVTTPVHTAESDEALLEDIDQKLSAPIPSPMQPLADPTAGATAAQSSSTQRKN